MTPLDLDVRATISRRGPIPFGEVVQAALYDPEHGFYVTGGQAGRSGDFLTSPEVGPLFGAVVARALDEWWRAAGQPAAYVVVEAGAGPGTLARAVLSAQPSCAAALRYVLVEQSAAQRSAHSRHLRVEDPTAAFASGARPPGEAGGLAPPPPQGPIVVSLSDLPRLPGPCIVLANELLDNLPFDLVERTAEGWADVLVGVEDDRLVEVLVPTQAEPGIVAPVGARIPVQPLVSRWLGEALDLAGDGGRVVAIDYWSHTDALVNRPWTDWVRTYRRHERGGSPLEALGTQDITCEVAIDQLAVPPTSDRSQASWLRAHGIEALVEDGRRTWRERAHIGDLDAVRARSRVAESDALLDEEGLGSFRVLEWER